MLSERVGQAPCQERIARDALQAIGELVHDANGDRVREFRDHVLQVLLENRPEGQSLDDLYADLMMFTSPSHCARITLDVITLFRWERASWEPLGLVCGMVTTLPAGMPIARVAWSGTTSGTCRTAPAMGDAKPGRSWPGSSACPRSSTCTWPRRLR